MNSLSFDHVHYRYSNLDETRRFYVGVMGAIELPSEELGGHLNYVFALGGVTLLFAAKDDKPSITEGQRLGAYHIAFLVENCDTATADLVCRGAVVAIQPFMASDQVRASFLTAPDGMTVELKQIIT